MRQLEIFIFFFISAFFHALNAPSADGMDAPQPMTIQAISSAQCWEFDTKQLQSPSERSHGFSSPTIGITSLLFEWPTPTERNFWMQGTPIPLLLFRLDSSGHRETVAELKPNDPTIDRDPGRGHYAIEIRLDHLSSKTAQSLKGVNRFRGGPFGDITDTVCVDINYRDE